MPASLTEVWNAVIAMFGSEGVFATAITTISNIPILLAPTFIGIAGLCLGLAKRTIRVGGRRGRG